jgi:hypothetical protein
MKLAVVLPYLNSLSPGQLQLAHNIKALSNPEIQGVFCGQKTEYLDEFGTKLFSSMPDVGKGLDGVILTGLTSIDAEYIWFFGDDYLNPDALKIVSSYLLAGQEIHPVILATQSVPDINQLGIYMSTSTKTDVRKLSGDDTFLQYKDELGYISRVIYATPLLRGQIEQLGNFVGTNWVCLAAIFVSIFPKNSSAEISLLDGVTVYGIERDQRKEHWYNYETFLYHLLEVMQKLVGKGYSFNSSSVTTVSRNIIWRALKARVVHKLDGIPHGYANDWNFARLKPLVPRSTFLILYLAYKSDFVLVFTARIKRWKHRFL